MDGRPKKHHEGGAERGPMNESEVFDALAETADRGFSDVELERLAASMEAQPELVHLFFRNLIDSGAINEPNENEKKLIRRLMPALIQFEQEDPEVEKLSDQVPEDL